MRGPRPLSPSPIPHAGADGTLTEGLSHVACGQCRLILRVFWGQAGFVFPSVAGPASKRRSVSRGGGTEGVRHADGRVSWEQQGLSPLPPALHTQRVSADNTKILTVLPKARIPHFSPSPVSLPGFWGAWGASPHPIRLVCSPSHAGEIILSFC